MSLTAKYDVFVSYSHADADWVTNILVPELERHGFAVIIDSRDFRGGGFSVEEMERSVLESRHVLLVLTEDYVKSSWAKFENVMAQTLDPAAIQRKIIPVLRKDCDIPLRLKILNYRDLRNPTSQSWQLLIQDLM